MKRSWNTQFKRKPKELRTDAAGITHDSVEEMERWNQLQLLQRTGRIRNLRRQVRYLLEKKEANVAIRTKTGRVAAYTADFVYERVATPEEGQLALKEGWVEIIEDHKGFPDKFSQFRIAVFEALYGVQVYIHRRGK